MANELNLDEFENFSDEAKEAAKEAIREVLSEKAKEVKEYLKLHVPRRTGGLSNSIIDVKIEDSDRRIAFRVIFEGTNEDGIAYQRIANSLNNGFFLPSGKFVTGKHFIDEAISLLRGMDEVIGSRFEILIGGVSNVGDN